MVLYLYFVIISAIGILAIQGSMIFLGNYRELTFVEILAIPCIVFWVLLTFICIGNSYQERKKSRGR